MLAEPRHKTKWTLNPRGKLWREDTNNFGKKMLEKMGWTEGKGLGAKEQGMTTPIAVKVKSDSRGLGFEGKDTDWCKHQEQFDSVLSALSESMEPVGGDAPTDSLEERSKASRVRLHYHKFTRGKDVSKYSEKDLACILGYKKELEVVEPPEETPIIENIGAVDSSYGVTTIVGGSYQDYLRKKMAAKGYNGVEGEERKGYPDGTKRKKRKKRDDGRESPHYGLGPLDLGEGIENDHSETKRTGRGEKSSLAEMAEADQDIVVIYESRRKRKSLSDRVDSSPPRKHSKVNANGTVSLEEVEIKLEDGEDNPKSDRSKKKRKSRSRMEESSSGVAMDEMVNGVDHPPASNADVVFVEEVEIVEEVKKKKKRRGARSESNSAEEVRENTLIESNDKVKLKKAKKSKRMGEEMEASLVRDKDAVDRGDVEDNVLVSSDVSVVEVVCEKNVGDIKKKKKKSKRDKETEEMEIYIINGTDEISCNSEANRELESDRLIKERKGLNKSKRNRKGEDSETLDKSTSVVDVKDKAPVKAEHNGIVKEKVKSKKKKRSQCDKGDNLSFGKELEDLDVEIIKSSKPKKKRKEEKEVPVECSKGCVRSGQSKSEGSDVEYFKILENENITKEELELSCRMFPGANLHSIAGYGVDE